MTLGEPTSGKSFPPGRGPAPLALFLLMILAALAVGVVLARLSSVAVMENPTPAPATYTPVSEKLVSAASLADYAGRIVFRCRVAAVDNVCVINPRNPQPGLASDASIHDRATTLEAFSPDGRNVVEAKRVGADFDLFIRDAQGRWQDQIVSSSDLETQPVWSPDGRWIAFVAHHTQGSSVMLYDTMDGTVRPLTEPGGWRDDHPSWSPDSQQVVFSTDRAGFRQLFVVNVGDGSQRRLDTGSIAAWDPVWVKQPRTQVPSPIDSAGPDALGIGLALDEDNCSVMISAGDVSGNVPVTRVELRANDEVVYDSGGLSRSSYRAEVNLDYATPEKELVLRVWNLGAFSREPRELRRSMTCVQPMETPTVDVRAGEPTNFTEEPLIIVTPVPAPADVFAAATAKAEATRLAVTVGTATPTPPNLATATFTPRPVVITSTPTPLNEATQAALDALATAVAFTTGTPTPLPPWVVTATATPTATGTPLPTSTPRPTNTPPFTPWRPADGGRFTPTPQSLIPGAFKGKILFRSNRDGFDAVYVMNPDGTNIGMLTADWPYELALEQEARSNDGRYLALVQNDTNGTQIHVLDAPFNLRKQVTFFGNGTSWDPALDPGGFRIAFNSNEAGNDEIYVVNRDGTGLQRLTQNTWEWDRHPSWSPDGTEIVFWSNRGSGRRQLYIMSADGRNVRRISDGYADDWDPVWVK